MEENQVNEIKIEYIKIMEWDVQAPSTTKLPYESQDWDFQQLNGYEVKEYGKAICRATDKP